jgi:PEP-CTERM motif
MNYLRLAIAILFAVTAQCSYADSIPTFWVTQATMFMGPNDGSGDNLGFFLTGPGVNIVGIGGMYCIDWCSFFPISDPSLAYPSRISLTEFGTVTIGGTSYNALDFYPSIFDENGGLNALVSGLAGADTGPLQFNLNLPTNGSWNFNFAPTTDNGNPAWIFTDGEFNATQVTPEPATVGLMGIGLAGIAGAVKRKARFRH